MKPLQHLLVVHVKAGRALDGQPCFPLYMSDFVYLSKATRADLLPAAKLGGIKVPQQPHIPMGSVGEVHIQVWRNLSVKCKEEQETLPSNVSATILGELNTHTHTSRHTPTRRPALLLSMTASLFLLLVYLFLHGSAHHTAPPPNH